MLTFLDVIVVLQLMVAIKLYFTKEEAESLQLIVQYPKCTNFILKVNKDETHLEGDTTVSNYHVDPLNIIVVKRIDVF